MASDFEKPDKVHTLFPPEIPKNVAASGAGSSVPWKGIGAETFTGRN